MAVILIFNHATSVVEDVLLVCSAVMVYDDIVATRVSMQTVALESLLGSIYLQHKLFQRRFDDKAEILSPSDEKHLPLPTCKAASSKSMQLCCQTLLCCNDIVIDLTAASLATKQSSTRPAM